MTTPTTYQVNVDSQGRMSTNPPDANVTSCQITCKVDDTIVFTLASGYYFTQNEWPLNFKRDPVFYGDLFNETKPDNSTTDTTTVSVAGPVTAKTTCNFHFDISPSVGKHDPSIVIDNG